MENTKVYQSGSERDITRFETLQCFFRKGDHAAKTARRWVIGDPSTRFLATSFDARKLKFHVLLHVLRKMPASSDSMSTPFCNDG